MNKAEDIEQLIYRELPPDRYCYIHNFIIEKDKEIERLNNIINEALGIANERFNYYHHTNKKEILEDWENIFNVLLRRDN